MTSSGAPRSACRRAATSASSIGPTTRMCSWYGVHPDRLASRPDALESHRTTHSGDVATTTSTPSNGTSIGTGRRSSNSSCIFPRQEQRRRLLDRLDDPTKDWKFSLLRPGGAKLLVRLPGGVRRGPDGDLHQVGSLVRHSRRRQACCPRTCRLGDRALHRRHGTATAAADA